MRFIFTASALCALVSTFAAPSAADQITVYGSARTYTIAQPAAKGPKGPQPTIIMLHDAKGTGAAIAQSTKLDTLAPQQGFVAVFPDGLRQQWNFFLPGKELEFYVKASKASGGVPDDGAFIKSLIDDLVRRGIADPRRIFIAGEGNGGLLALRMLCTDANLFAGAALVAAAMPEKLGADCHPLRGVPILMIKGTKDEVLPFTGGLVEPEETFRVWPNDRLVKFLQVLNNQSGSPQSADLPRRIPNLVKVDRWSACPGMPLTVYGVMDGPHIAPADLSEGQIVLEFFAAPGVVNACVASLPPGAGASGNTDPGGGSGAPGSNAADPNAPQNNPPGTGANGPGTTPGTGNDPGQGTNTPSAANAPGTTDGPNATDPNAPNGSPNSASAPGGTDTAGLGPPDSGNSANPGGDTAGLGPPPDDSNPGNTAGLGPPPDSPGNPTGGLGPPPNPPTTTAMGTPMGPPPPYYPPMPPVYIPNPPGPPPMPPTGNMCQPPSPPMSQPPMPPPPTSNGGTNSGGTKPGGTTLAGLPQGPTGTGGTASINCGFAGDGKNGAKGQMYTGFSCSYANGKNTCTDCTGKNPCTADVGSVCTPRIAANPPAHSDVLKLLPSTPPLTLQPATLPPPTLTPTGNVCNPKPANVCSPKPATSAATHDPSPKTKEVDKKPRPTNNNNAASAAANAAATAATATAIMGLVGAIGHHGGGGGGGHFGGGGGHSGGGMGGNVCHHR